MQMLLASEYGFSPENDGIENREKLQKILDIGGHILVDKPGVYDVCGMVLIGSNTTLEFTKGGFPLPRAEDALGVLGVDDLTLLQEV